MPRDVACLLDALRRVIADDADRRVASDENAVRASETVALMPVVHRTADPKSPRDWRRILGAEPPAIALSAVLSDEEAVVGLTHAAYFFLGCAAKPEGNVALVLQTDAVTQKPSTFSPFDSGALGSGYLRPADEALDWSNDARAQALDMHTGAGSDLGDFAGEYVGGHFRNPDDYVRREQTSEPDFPTYHGLRSSNGDRRAWSIEVRSHEPVNLEPAGVLQHIVLARRQLFHDVPERFCDRVVVAQSADGQTGDVAATVASVILHGSGGAA